VSYYIVARSFSIACSHYSLELSPSISPCLIPSVVIPRPTTASRPSNLLNPSHLAPQIRLCWPLCTLPLCAVSVGRMLYTCSLVVTLLVVMFAGIYPAGVAAGNEEYTHWCDHYCRQSGYPEGGECIGAAIFDIGRRCSKCTCKGFYVELNF